MHWVEECGRGVHTGSQSVQSLGGYHNSPLIKHAGKNHHHLLSIHSIEVLCQVPL